MSLKNKIHIRPNGLMEYKFTKHGVRHTIYGRTKQEVKQKYSDLIKKLRKSPVKKKVKKILSFHNWIEKWYSLYKEKTLSESSLYNLGNYINRIKKNIKDKPLKNITSIELQEFLNSIPQTRTRKALHMHLNDCLNKAEMHSLITINPMKAVPAVKHTYAKGKALTKEEENQFLNKIKKIDKQLANYYKFCLYSGGRRSEVLSIKWSDINFLEKTIHLQGTKNNTSNRIIPLFDSLAEITASIDKRSDKIFEFLPDFVTKSFADLMPGHKLHNLRHTFATRCLEKGVSMKTVQLWLGHSTYQQTANTYSHILEAFNQSEIDKLND